MQVKFLLGPPKLEISKEKYEMKCAICSSRVGCAGGSTHPPGTHAVK